MGEAWIFGIDGGGTSCRLKAESVSGNFLFRSESTGGNPRSVGWEGASKVIRSLFEALYSKTGLNPADCAGGFAGMAGIGRPDDKARMSSILRSASGTQCPIKVDTDALPALVGALGKKEGILLIAGTGSIAFGMTSGGDMVRSGGWGHILGDEGSAYDVGRQGLSAATRSCDSRGPTTRILNLALEYFDITSPFDLIPAVYENFSKSRIARFAEKVATARDEGDEIAHGIFINSAQALSGLVVSVAGKLGTSPYEKRIAILGGFIENDDFLRHEVERLLAAALPDFDITPAQADGLTGACILAHDIAMHGHT